MICKRRVEPLDYIHIFNLIFDACFRNALWHNEVGYQALHMTFILILFYKMKKKNYYKQQSIF